MRERAASTPGAHADAQPQQEAAALDNSHRGSNDSAVRIHNLVQPPHRSSNGQGHRPSQSTDDMLRLAQLQPRSQSEPGGMPSASLEAQTPRRWWRRFGRLWRKQSRDSNVRASSGLYTIIPMSGAHNHSHVGCA